MVLGQWVQLAAHQSRSNGTVTTGSRALPTGFSAVTLRVDCTTGTEATPFTGFSPSFSSSSMALTFTTHFSWDGGATFPENAATTVNGSATGTWGEKSPPNMAPMFVRGIPFNAALGGPPTHYKADLTLSGGPVDFGISFMES